MTATTMMAAESNNETGSTEAVEGAGGRRAPPAIGGDKDDNEDDNDDENEGEEEDDDRILPRPIVPPRAVGEGRVVDDDAATLPMEIFGKRGQGRPSQTPPGLGGRLRLHQVSSLVSPL